MAHIKDLRERPAGYQGTKPYWARYRDPLGKEHGQTFRTMREARHWLAENEVAKGRGAHDGWLLPGKAEVHSGQAVHKEVGCRIYKVF